MKKIVMLAALASSVAVVTPALAWNGGKPSSSGGHSSTSSSGGYGSSGGHSSSGGYSSTSTSGGSHAVPEPGMIGLMGAGVVGLLVARRRRKPRG